MRKLVAFLSLVLLLVACSHDVGGALHDVGIFVIDAGDAMSDDAAAQDDAGGSSSARIVEMPCDGIGVVSIRSSAGGAFTQRVTFYAGLTDLSITTMHPDVSAIICDRSVVGDYDPEDDSCGSIGTGCTDTRPDHLACVTVPVEIDNGHVRVVCGGSERQDDDGPGPMPTLERGHRYSFARFVLR